MWLVMSLLFLLRSLLQLQYSHLSQRSRRPTKKEDTVLKNFYVETLFKTIYSKGFALLYVHLNASARSTHTPSFLRCVSYLGKAIQDSKKEPNVTCNRPAMIYNQRGRCLKVDHDFLVQLPTSQGMEDTGALLLQIKEAVQGSNIYSRFSSAYVFVCLIK